MDAFDLDPARLRPFSEGRHRPTYLILGLTAVAAIVAGAGAAGAGLGVVVLGLLTATIADFLRWRDEEIASGGLTFNRPMVTPAPPRALPAPAIPVQFEQPAAQESETARPAPARPRKARTYASAPDASDPS